MKIAIFGATGLLGSNLINLYKSIGFDVKGFSRSFSNNIYVIDFDNIENELKTAFIHWKPDVIINTVALVNLQKCEDNFDLANYSNNLIAQKLARFSKNYNSYYIHISTDHFFNDNLEKHKESDNILLLNNYAKTKYLAESSVLDIYPKALVVRTNIIGFRNSNVDSFFEWLLKSLFEKEKINLFDNFCSSPISVNQLGLILIQVFKHKLNGIYNISSSEVISKYDFGIKVANKFNLSTKNISKVKLEDKNSSIKRALTLGLDIAKIEQSLNIKMPLVDEIINQLHKEYYESK